MSTSRTGILLGPPGTGKTTSLLKEVEDAIKSGTPLNRIAFFAFTRRAAQEAIVGACERFGCKQDDLPWFRTLHSAAFRILGLKFNEVMQTHHFEELGKALGSFTFKATYGATMERAPPDGGLGDLAMNIYSRARASQSSVEVEWRRADDPRITLRDATRFALALDEYKHSQHILDFTDFLDGVHEPIDLDLMIIDEAQDLTLQQWGFARRIGRTAKRVLIAGDDDQAIFEWAGADVRTFLSIKGDPRVLPISYRLPRVVWERANSISRRIRVRREKLFQPRDEEGEILNLDSPEQIRLLDPGSFLLLSRHRWQLEALANVCRDQGVVYFDGTEWSNQSAAVRAVVLYERLRKGNTLTLAQMQRVVRFIPGTSELDTSIKEWTWGLVIWPFTGEPDWMSAMTGVGLEEREYIRKLRRTGESLVNPGRVTLSTIHGSKGGEADTVMILPDMSKRVASTAMKRPDEEARVWYVAASRAKHRLGICAPSSRRFYTV